MKLDARKRFSLLENGILDKPSCRLLLINVRLLTPPSKTFQIPN